MKKHYEITCDSRGKWSVIDTHLRKPVSFQGRYQIALTEDVARDTLRRLNEIECEQQHQLESPWWR